MSLTAASSWTSQGLTRCNRAPNVSSGAAWTTTVPSPQATNNCMLDAYLTVRQYARRRCRAVVRMLFAREVGLATPSPSPREGQALPQRRATASALLWRCLLISRCCTLLSCLSKRPRRSHDLDGWSAGAEGQGAREAVHGRLFPSLGAPSRLLCMLVECFACRLQTSSWQPEW